MAVSIKIDPIGKDIALFFAPELTPEGQRTALASFAREQLADAQNINGRAIGRVPRHDTYVDGQKGASEDNVRPDGVIIYEFELVTDVIVWIQEQLIRHSPIRSGRFRKSHLLFADGVEVQFGADIPAANRYVFVNSQPYARKIERGLSSQAPEGVFEVVAVLANRRFSNIAQVRFTFESLLGGNTHLESWARRTRQTRRGSAKQVAEWNRRQPAIAVTVR